VTRMPRVVHIVVTDAFAGVERYVCNVAAETARRGWDVAVVGGNAAAMRSALPEEIVWKPGATLRQAIRSVAQLGRQDVCHAQMTAAEAVAVVTRPLHRAPVVSTRHFAARRGASQAGRLASPVIAAGIAREVAIGEFVAAHLERAPAAIVLSGVPASACLWRPANRVVLVLQRLEPEKDTLTALQAWRAARLVRDGWTLRIAGDGSERQMLEAYASSEALRAVTFTGWTPDVDGELRRAGALLATAPAEPLGLSVLEAMAAGVPVVACGSGGHLETAGRLLDAPLFAPRNGLAAAEALDSLLSVDIRSRLSEHGRRLVAERFTIERHVDGLITQYEATRTGAACGRAAPTEAGIL
jgi:glycosyltransferase involved in cell wall biosynthesis